MVKIEERYAEALLQLSESQANALNALADCCKDSEIKSFFESPEITPEVKKEFLSNVLSSGFDQVLQNFIMLLIDKNRFSLLPEIAESYACLVDQSNGVSHMKIFTATKLPQQQIEALKEKFSASKAEIIIDPLLLGGIKVQVNDKVYDNSLKTMLTQMLGSEADER